MDRCRESVSCPPAISSPSLSRHYQARNVHIEWEDVRLGRKVKGTGVFLIFSATPGEIWRGSVPLGYDNELVYGNLLGIDGTCLSALEEKGVI